MGFSTKRGRPSLNRPRKDKGTVELQAKRSLNLTTEAIDLCLHKQLITSEQHRAALRLRWLYTLRFGLPTTQAYDHLFIKGHNNYLDDSKWRQKRNQEYETAISLLKSIKACSIVTNLAIFNQYPKFLLISRNLTIIELKKIASSIFPELVKFQEGLDVLIKFFERRNENHINRCRQDGPGDAARMVG
jgi:hypothetical protein